MTIILIGDPYPPSQNKSTNTQLDLLDHDVITEDLDQYTVLHTQKLSQSISQIDHMYKRKITRLQITITVLCAIWTLGMIPISIGGFYHDFLTLLVCFMIWGLIVTVFLDVYSLKMKIIHTQWSDAVSPASLGE
ncbi:MAG: hypothetical protein VXY77_03615 [Pseudomonadota bacterium]|nr:hypothetical protein [Pseudomonadota bacterium]